MDQQMTAGTVPGKRLQTHVSIETSTPAHFWRIDRIAIFFLILNILSAALFIKSVNRPVYDELYNMSDVHRYVTEGVSADTIRRQVNAQGPTSFILMTGAIRLLKTDELRGARLAVLVSWLLLGGGILVGSRYSRFPHLWHAALLTTLVFPHAATATGSALTEGPALLFAVVGFLVWVEFASRPVRSPGIALLLVMAGLSMGLAITSRQYFLMLVPTAALFIAHELRQSRFERSSLWYAAVFLSLVFAIIPLVPLVLVWKGLSSPGMVSGLSYVGHNISRPLLACFYTAVYLLPLTFPRVQRLRCGQRRKVMLFATTIGIVMAYFRSFFLQPGPLNSLVHVASRVRSGDLVLFALISTLAVYNAISLGILLWEKSASIVPVPLFTFAVLAVTMFLAEQVGVGGTSPFFDRYMLQLAPFLGIIAFTLFPRLTTVRVLALGTLFLISNGMLWRYAFAR